MLLVSTSDKIQVITGTAVTTDVHASYMDADNSTTPVITPGRKNTAISTATTTDVVSAPASSHQINVKYMTVRNTHASSSVDITVQHTDGTTTVTMHKVTLLPGGVLQYVEGLGFQML